MTLPEGTQLGRYEIHSKIGSGGMGEVYLAKDTRLNRKIALKLLPPDLTGNKDRLQRFKQEARAASSLNHPNILTIHEIGLENGLHFIATEFVEGVTLKDHIKSARMKLDEALELAIQVTGALAAAHAAGIIHRDIKPDNVMLRADGYVKVLDFGLAKLMEQNSGMRASDPEAPTKPATHTDPGVVMGTSRYMSPEQACGLPVDARTDIWSLGVLIYEMIAGHAPFEGDSAAQIIARVLEREPQPLASYASDAPSELQRIVSKALAKDCDTRYSDAKDLLGDLKALKQELAFQERSIALGAQSNAPYASTSGGQTASAPASGEVAQTSSAANSLPPDTSAEYVAGKLKRYKLAAIIVPLVVVGLALGLWLYLRAGSSESTIDSIAVLPFVNQNHDPETEYLSDGLTESIINSLAQLPNVRVIARSSVFRYKGKETDPIAFGKDLGVRAVLAGRIMQRGEELTVSVELVDVRDNKQLWGEQYKRKMSDLLAMQHDIAQEISSNLRMKISGEVQNRVTKHYTENSEAYQLYLKGRYFWNKRTGEDLKKSIDYFNQAIELDPNYALAYAGLADAYVLFSGYSVSTPQDSYPKAKAAARRALDLDETLAEAHAALGLELFAYEWKAAESSREFRRAIELNPNYATAHHWYGNQNLLYTGRFDEAIAEMKRAQELDPLSLIVNADLGDTYFYARQYDKAIEQLRKTIEMDQSFYYAHYELGMAYEMKGSYAEAITEYQKARQLNNDPRVLALLAHAYASSGRRDEALRILDQLKEIEKQQYVAAYNFVIVYAGLGDHDQAFQWLEKSYQDHASRMTILQVDPFLDPLRSDPRFADLVQKVGL